MFYTFLTKGILKPIVKYIYRPEVKGLEKIPAEGKAIFASNHLAASDSIFFPVYLPRPIVFFAKSDYFYTPGFKGKVQAAFFTALKQIPVDRRGGEHAKKSFNSAEDILERGDFFGIYPEGTRSTDGKLHKGKTGVARIALETNTKVYPVAMINTNKAQPVGTLIPRLKPKVGFIIGDPLDFSEYYDKQDDREILRKVTDETMKALQKLSGQEYIHEYSQPATKRLSEKEQVIRD
ncbi:MAG: lysophospholipid acyltransferase family protein [Micrococcaceae bacterium]